MIRLMLVLVLTLALGAGARAGQSCEDRPLGAEQVRNAFALALKVRQALEQSGAQVAILGRVGQDLSRYGLRYSHVGFVWRDHPAGPWLGVHLLNACGSARSDLYSQGLANFFADDLFAWDALVLIPSSRVQQQLAAGLAGADPLRLHQPRYNMVAYPFATRYQNSNQWVLEMLAQALAGRSFAGRDEAQSWLKANGYGPTTLRIPPLTRLGGRLFKANVAFDDHPLGRRLADQIDTVTVDSVADFLARQDPGGRRLVLGL